MEGLKNIVILKNLPSNIIEEAFVVVKHNLKIENIEENNEKGNKTDNYIVKEAEMVIKSYLDNINNLEEKKQIKKIEEKYKKLKALTIWFALVALLGGIINFI